MNLSRFNQKTNTNNNADNAAYLKIWQAMNQLELPDRNADFLSYKIGIRSAESYFTTSDQYKIINLESLEEEEKVFLNDIGLSVEFLKQNRELIGESGVIERKVNVTDYQDSILELGAIYAICPSTGKILRSNRSLPFGTVADRKNFGYGCYRFVGKEVFYIVSGPPAMYMKMYLFFPRMDLVVLLAKHKNLIARSINEIVKFNHWKSYVVANCNKILTYLMNGDDDRIQKALVFGHPNLAHYFGNILSGIQRLSEKNLLNQVDSFLVISQEYFGNIDEIFPELATTRMQRLLKRASVDDEILEHNYFALRVCGSEISEALADRIYQVAKKRCSDLLIQEIEEAKKNSFPLFWVGIRSNHRIWLSQAEGLANIINTLSSHFPNLAIVFDGFCTTSSELVNPDEEQAIQKDKEVANQVKSLLLPHIKVYDIIGCQTYENLVWAYAINFYLSTSGTAVTKVAWLANKPGVVHSNKFYFQNTTNKIRKNGIDVVYVPLEYIVELDEGARQSDYECDWRVLYEEVLKIALSIDS